MIPSPHRRRLLLASAAASLAWPAWAQNRPIRLGSTLDASGVEKANGTALHRGASAFFAGVNKAGGLQGRKIELVLADDGFNPDTARANAQAFAADASVLGLLTTLGTRQSAAVFDAVKDMAFIGPSTGTAGLRKASPPNVFWVRASYDEEITRLVQNAITLGFRKIGVVHPDDPLGKSVYAAIERTLRANQLTPEVVTTTPGTTSPLVEPAAKAIAAANPQLVLVVLAGVVPLFVKALRATGNRSTLYGLSIGASPANIQTLGEQARGMGFAIVVPSPFAPKFEIVRRYQADMKAAGDEAFSLMSLEGYIHARIAWEALKRAGPAVTREAFIDALEGIVNLDLGGLTIDYGRANRQGSRYVDVAVIGANGRLMA